LRDERFVYCADLSSRNAERWTEHRALFGRLVESFLPVPAPAGTLQGSSIVDHWAG